VRKHGIGKEFHHAGIAATENQSHFMCCQINTKVNHRLSEHGISNISRAEIYGNTLYNDVFQSNVISYSQNFIFCISPTAVVFPTTLPNYHYLTYSNRTYRRIAAGIAKENPTSLH
jgi:hypothetical protein